tara:strand:+ start:59 stop:370 length:312 start_codon:yes stop_codon:yes gene_type:complete
MTDIDLAKLCHKTHNEFCKAIREEVREWNDLPQEHIDTIISSIINIKDGKFETAEQAHHNYVRRKIDAGIVNKRTVVWSELSECNKTKEMIFFNIVVNNKINK